MLSSLLELFHAVVVFPVDTFEEVEGVVAGLFILAFDAVYEEEVDDYLFLCGFSYG